MDQGRCASRNRALNPREMKGSSLVIALGLAGVAGFPAPSCSGAEGAVRTGYAKRARFASPPVAKLDAKVNLFGAVSGLNPFAPDLSICCGSPDSQYPWKLNIVSTVFWIGERSSPGNLRSAWDAHWLASYGGVDDPKARVAFQPANFVPRQNPFYVALPYCDMKDGRLKAEAAKVVPWFIESFRGPDKSVCQGRWIAIRHGLVTCYAQWEDVGPFRTDHWQYVFGDERPAPNVNRGAGIDLSPAVRDYLGLNGIDTVDWRFVDESQVPRGPWLWPSQQLPNHDVTSPSAGPQRAGFSSLKSEKLREQNGSLQ
jgi:hypothetical protein